MKCIALGLLFSVLFFTFSASAESSCSRFYRGQVLVAKYQKQLIVGTLHTKGKVRVERINSDGWSVDIYFLRDGKLLDGVGCLDLKIMTGMKKNTKGYDYIFQF